MAEKQVDYCTTAIEDEAISETQKSTYSKHSKKKKRKFRSQLEQKDAVEEREPLPRPTTTMCSQCKNKLQVPFLLVCLHSICKNCLRLVRTEDRYLKCPSCSDSSTLAPEDPPSDKCDPTSSYPVFNGPLARYIQGDDVLKKVSQNEAILCENEDCDGEENEAVVFCLSEFCWKFYCSSCYKAHRRMRSTLGGIHDMKSIEELRSKDGSISVMLMEKALNQFDQIACPIHEREVLKLFCEKCDIPLCLVCAVDKHTTAPHSPKYLQVDSINQTADNSSDYKLIGRLTNRVITAYKKQQHNKENTYTDQLNTVNTMKDISLKQAKESFQRIRCELERREQELCNYIEKKAMEKMDYFEQAAKNCQMLANEQPDQSSLFFYLLKGKTYEKTAFRNVVLKKQANVVKASCLKQPYPSVTLKYLPDGEEMVVEDIENFGFIEEGATPSNCTIDSFFIEYSNFNPKPDRAEDSKVDPKPDRAEDSKVDPKPDRAEDSKVDPKPDRAEDSKVDSRIISNLITLELTTANQDNVPCTSGGDDVQVYLNLRPPYSSPAIRGVTEDMKNGKYKLILRKIYLGRCHLLITVNGEHINGSPFELEICISPLLKRDIQTIANPKGNLDFPHILENPNGIAVSWIGNIFVSSYSTNIVHVFNAQREYIGAIGQYGEENEAVAGPRGLAINEKGEVLITNNKGVDVVSEYGVFIKRFGNETLSNPYDITIHQPSGDIYVADYSNHRIAVFSKEGDFQKSIGCQGSGNGQFKSPTGVAISADELLYVSEYGNNRIQVLRLDGNFVRIFGNGHLSNPYHLLLHQDGSVLVCDYYNNKIQVFNATGDHTHSISTNGRPFSIAVDHNEDIFVGCQGNFVQIF